jgi:predicted transcriptional regulator
MKNADIIKAYKERQQLVLQIVKKHQPITTKALAARVGCNIKTMSGVVSKLLTAKQLIVAEGSTKRNYMLRLTRPEDLGHTPPIERVERFQPTGIFRGLEWNPDIARPGASDFLKCPTRIGDNRYPYRTPIYGVLKSHAQKV